MKLCDIYHTIHVCVCNVCPQLDFHSFSVFFLFSFAVFVISHHFFVHISSSVKHETYRMNIDALEQCENPANWWRASHVALFLAFSLCVFCFEGDERNHLPDMFVVCVRARCCVAMAHISVNWLKTGSCACVCDRCCQRIIPNERISNKIFNSN